MRFETVTKRIGEKVAPLDFSCADLQFADQQVGPERFAAQVQSLRDIDTALAQGNAVIATTYGGWPRLCWQPVVDTGMYDGWPYWRPYPCVCMRGPLGVEWKSFAMLSGHKIVATPPAQPTQDTSP